MADSDRTEGGVRAPRAGRTHRRKHALRAIFRSAALLLLLGGCALCRSLGGGGGAGGGGGTPAMNSRYIPADGLRGGDTGKSRSLASEGGEDASSAAADAADAARPEDEEAPCPEVEVADPAWLLAPYAAGTLYMFLALAIVCDEYFVPALEEMSSDRRLDLGADVAGATLMAAGGSAPELFTGFVGTFRRSDIAIGTIVGSAVFNVLFVIGACSLLSREVLTLTPWPLVRDASYYAAGLLALALFLGLMSEGVVEWWEALALFGMYLGYVLLMYFNRRLYRRLTGRELVLPEDEGDNEDKSKLDRTVSCTSGTEAGDMGARVTPLLSDDSLGSSDGDGPSPLADRQSWMERGGVGMVAESQGDVDRAFEQVDINGDGAIDEEELGRLFRKLGHKIGEGELRDAFRGLDLDGDGLIRKEEFCDWFARSERRLLDTFGVGGSDTIDHGEVGKLLRALEVGVTDADVDDAVGAAREGGAGQMTYEEFIAWNMKYIASPPGGGGDDEDRGPCAALSPPRGEGALAWLAYLVALPLVAAMALTVPDVRRPGRDGWCYVSFLVSIAWIGVFSYYMVEWVELIGNTAGIPPVVMGYTVLAAGTSAPDLFSSVIVARMGRGDMAVSGSIGSNIFDILVGLPLPWLVFTLWPSTPDVVVIQVTGIWQSILILIGMLVLIIAIVHCQGWKMTRTLGGLMFLLYFAFLVQAILTEYFLNPCFG